MMWRRSALIALLFAVTLVPAAGAVGYETTDDWGSGFTGRITITNDTGTTLENWILEFDFDRTIETIWDARILSRDGTRHTIVPAGWNNRIRPGAVVSFGFGGAPGHVTGGPSNFNLRSGSQEPGVEPPGSGMTHVTITETARWDGGFTGSLTIANGDTQPIVGWTLSFDFDARMASMWNGSFTQQGQTVQVTNDASGVRIPPGGAVTLGFSATGVLRADSASNCLLNSAGCAISIVFSPPPGTAPPANAGIDIGDLDDAGEVTQITIPQGTTAYQLKLRNQAATAEFAVTTNNPRVAAPSLSDSGELRITGLRAGRASLRIEDRTTQTVRFVGVRVRNSDDSLPGMPDYVAIGSVSEDTPEHLEFWRSFQAGATMRRSDIRYIYLNGGPVGGWDTWGSGNGNRAVSYIRNSRTLGMIPVFVLYNIPDAAESYQLDLAHVQDVNYVTAYFRNLKLALDIINTESPDDLVGMILEPDFLGYLAQNANKPASAISAATRGAYDSGVLSRDGDPDFEDSVRGLVRAINYAIGKYAPQVWFGWQLNLWASPAGGWTTPIPVRGLIHKTEDSGISQGRTEIYREAAAITRYYVEAGVTSYGARFMSIDKYGLDAVGFEAAAANDPAGSFWFWNNDLWHNYLLFARAVRDMAALPVILWQLPVGRINQTTEANPFHPRGTFGELGNGPQTYEDSAAPFFFGDTFVTSGQRFSYFAANQGNDPKLLVNGNTITWGSHVAEAADAGVIAALFGAGVGLSTTNLGAPPSDGYWWVTKAVRYLANPTPALTRP